ncbi:MULTISPECIES: hypothetical protein [unclassified Streptomyces]|uniref:hypothetical protein n=1 Tax=unclassified Streptomyces TaxID=2593676 RepID=UPI0013175D7F|nr:MULTISPECIES: hypothetical protein [unclassified Streptomyces]QHC27529.1 hypothetical protein GR129_00295 [Streptomyces sp. HF10]WKE67547.1 hypothetical protein QHG49_00095 [Streptomyces sp. WP-1]
MITRGAQDDLVRICTKGAAVGMPALHTPDTHLVAKVSDGAPTRCRGARPTSVSHERVVLEPGYEPDEDLAAEITNPHAREARRRLR